MVENCTKKKKRWMASALEALTFEADINGDIPFKTLCRAPRRRRRWKTSVCKKSDIVRTKTMCLYHIIKEVAKTMMTMMKMITWTRCILVYQIIIWDFVCWYLFLPPSWWWWWRWWWSWWWRQINGNNQQYATVAVTPPLKELWVCHSLI